MLLMQMHKHEAEQQRDENLDNLPHGSCVILGPGGMTCSLPAIKESAF